MAQKRKGISKRLRFEVFKRDGFKCQYCGKAAPDVVLNADHIVPVSEGGLTELLNLITACLECNSGKSNVALSDDAAVRKQRAQLDQLQLRREQMEMIVRWRQELSRIDEETAQRAADAWKAGARGWFLNEKGLGELRRLIKQFGLEKVLNAMEIARTQYMAPNTEGKVAQDQVERAWSKIGGICRMSDQPEWKRQIYYARGILRNRVAYVREDIALDDLMRAYQAGVPLDDLFDIVRRCHTWSQFRAWIDEAIKDYGGTG